MNRILLFGDSITAGYRNQEITSALTDKIQAAFPTYEVMNAGIPGNTTVDGLKRIEEHVLKYQPKYVVVFFGANDVATHFLVRRRDYHQNLIRMIEQIGKEKVILFSAPYVNQRIRLVDRPLSRIERYVTTAQEVARAENVPFVNMLQEMLETGDEKRLLQDDGLHFSEEGYVFLSQLMINELKKKMERD